MAQNETELMIRGSGATTQQVSKRLQSELMTLMMSGDKVWLIMKKNCV